MLFAGEVGSTRARSLILGSRQSVEIVCADKLTRYLLLDEGTFANIMFHSRAGNYCATAI